MTDSDPQLIRHATIDDLDALAAMESECFPAAEAADRSSLRARIETYPECFWLLIDGEIVMAFINGFATDRRDLTDDMYEDAAQHNPQGDWQMIFGVDTAPKYQHRGCASTLMRKVIEDTRAAGRKGLVLTCKDRLGLRMFFWTVRRPVQDFCGIARGSSSPVTS